MYKVHTVTIDKEFSDEEWTGLIVAGENIENGKRWSLPVKVKLDRVSDDELFIKCEDEAELFIKCEDEAELRKLTAVVNYLQARYDIIVAILKGAF